VILPRSWLTATNEGEGLIKGDFDLNSQYIRRQTVMTWTSVTVSNGYWTQQINGPFTTNLVRKGNILNPQYMICPKVAIVYPTDPVPVDGEDGASPSPVPTSLYVFDNDLPGQCKVKVGMTNYPGLSATSRGLKRRGQ
jgi:hypothetical protein